MVVDPASGVATVQISAENTSTGSLTLDALDAFSLGGITPFASDDTAGRLRVHRCRSAWSAEGRLDTRSIEDLHLERSWTGHAVRTERFGQVGSLPVNGWFPFVAIEDRAAEVTWAIQLATPGTWHLELYRRADQFALGGGGADRLAGEWSKTLAPGETFLAPPAFLTAVTGNIDDVCDRLLLAMRVRACLPPREATLPIIFNEWCTSWGNPTHDSLVALAGRLAGSGVTYLVIDDGWAERPGNQFQQNGDWRVNRRAFPQGLRPTTDAIRAHGLVPGLWFEFEAINPGSDAWQETTHQLHRDGVPLQVGARRFWDFRDPWVHDFLAQRVIARLRDDGFGCLKIDCNDSIGPGVDGLESPGENLRQHLAGVQRFFERLRDELPDLVIENCSSGGHRLEPSMMALTSMSSFSDAHETPDIPLIAADLNRVVWSAQKQIWAVLRANDSLQRLSYSLAATFLGRMCLSGEVDRLSSPAWDFTRAAMNLYRQVTSLIRDGRFRADRCVGSSRQHPTGHQIVTITDVARRQLLIIWHCFDAPSLSIFAPDVDDAWHWKIHTQLCGPETEIELLENKLRWRKTLSWSGGVLWLIGSKKPESANQAESLRIE
ncbi:glycoside hydrolase family 36 protein [Nibricoccus aquaticus]|uniref:glycoside hydrolase family 36 protein n=1 Tax=Nibricoccus aquaticus TaxID=2576891 RepID=UPI0015867021|nr:glycoside hydrolase family 36 protein [Nibricoccus aquaticus]